jgi:hypothetical protein
MERKNFIWSICHFVRRVSGNIITTAKFLYMLRKMDFFIWYILNELEGRIVAILKVL